MHMSQSSGVKHVLMSPFHSPAVSKFFPSVWCQWPLFGPLLHDLCWQVRCKGWKDIHLPWRVQEQQHKDRGTRKRALISIPASKSQRSHSQRQDSSLFQRLNSIWWMHFLYPYERGRSRKTSILEMRVACVITFELLQMEHFIFKSRSHTCCMYLVW